MVGKSPLDPSVDRLTYFDDYSSLKRTLQILPLFYKGCTPDRQLEIMKNLSGWDKCMISAGYTYYKGDKQIQHFGLGKKYLNVINNNLEMFGFNTDLTNNEKMVLTAWSHTDKPSHVFLKFSGNKYVLVYEKEEHNETGKSKIIYTHDRRVISEEHELHIFTDASNNNQITLESYFNNHDRNPFVDEYNLPEFIIENNQKRIKMHFDYRGKYENITGIIVETNQRELFIRTLLEMMILTDLDTNQSIGVEEMEDMFEIDPVLQKTFRQQSNPTKMQIIMYNLIIYLLKSYERNSFVVNRKYLKYMGHEDNNDFKFHN